MKKLLALTCMIVTAISAMAGFTFLDWPANGDYVSGIGPVKILSVDITGSAITNGTVILKRIPADGTSTNAYAFGTLTCSGGQLQKAITNDCWIFMDDVIQRTGTATNARVRVITEH